MTGWQAVGVFALFAGIVLGGLAAMCCIAGKALRKEDNDGGPVR